MLSLPNPNSDFPASTDMGYTLTTPKRSLNHRVNVDIFHGFIQSEIPWHLSLSFSSTEILWVPRSFSLFHRGGVKLGLCLLWLCMLSQSHPLQSFQISLQSSDLCQKRGKQKTLLTHLHFALSFVLATSSQQVLLHLTSSGQENLLHALIFFHESSCNPNHVFMSIKY